MFLVLVSGHWITGGQPLEYSRQKDEAPVVVLEGGGEVAIPGIQGGPRSRLSQ